MNNVPIFKNSHGLRFRWQWPVHPPIDWFVPHFFESLVGLAETPTAHKGRLGLGGSQWARVRAAQNNVLFGISNQCRLGLFRGGLAPQQKDQGFVPLCDCSDDRIRKVLPSPLFVAVGLGLADRQDVVDQEDALFGPSFQISVLGNGIEIGNLWIVHQFLVNVAQGGRGLNSTTNGKAEAVGLVGPVVGILSDNDQLGLGERTQIQGGKGVLWGRKDGLFLSGIIICKWEEEETKDEKC